MESRTPLGWFTRAWPWLVLLALVTPAVWHWLDFPEDLDPEYPAVIRPTYNLRPPPAYRLAEPGDTIDRIAIYLSSICIVVALRGTFRAPGTLWQTALALSLGALWHASTPGPTFDGWHGFGFTTIVTATAPESTRWAIGLATTALFAYGLWPFLKAFILWKPLLKNRRLESMALGAFATFFVILRQVEIPNIEPIGYWERWSFVWGLSAFGLLLIKNSPNLPTGSSPKLKLGLVGLLCWFGLVGSGIGLSWYHRPLARLHTVEPGKIYMSAMPTYRGLQVAHARHGFKTIINLFDESSSQKSPLSPDELRFCRENNIRYVGSPPGAINSDIFLDETLKLARDPAAWPILVHCHGCMDRSPAWMGIYRFVVQEQPLDAIFREIEAHRGYRPKSSVTVLYNRVLPARAPRHFAADPTAQAMIGYVKGVHDPFYDSLPTLVNPNEPPRLSMTNSTVDEARELAPPLLDSLDRSDTVPRADPIPVPPPIGAPTMTPEPLLSETANRIRTPAISELMQTALANPGLISLAAGFVDQASLPIEITAQVAEELLSNPGEGRRAMQYGTTPGDVGLRKQLLIHQEKTDGVAPGTYAHLLPRTIVTTGSAQLLYMVSESLLNPGDIVLVEAPTYFVFLGNLDCRGAVAIGVETDEGGIKIDALEATLADLESQGKLDRVKLIYTVTEHSNPTGISLAADRRMPLIDVARKWSKRHQILVLDDAAYRGLSFDGVEPKTLWGHDDRDGEGVILARSFSKTFSPGIKTGYGILPTTLVSPLICLKGNHDFGSANLNQLILEQVMADGHYDRHLERIIGVYRQKRDRFLNALDIYLKPIDPDLSWTRGAGGLFVWLTVPEGLDTGRDGRLFQTCLDEGVIYVPGAYCFSAATGPVPTNHARLSFGVANEADLVEGVKRLGQALSHCLEHVS